MRMHTAGWIGLLVAIVGAVPAMSQDASAAGRRILDAQQDAVVTVRIVISQQYSMAGQSDNEEMTDEVTGTVIHPTGLTVLSLSETDPSTMIKAMMGGGGGILGGFQIESKLTDVKIMLRDGTEIPAEVALRDADLDLIYIRPKETPKTPLAHVDIQQNADADVLQQLVGLSRLGKAANRASAASFEYVHAVVQRPRRFYVLGKDNTQTSLGSPVFDLTGKLVGFVVVRTIQGTDSGGMMGMMMSGAGDNMLPIVLPATTVAQYIDQALQVEVESKEGNEAPASAPSPTEDAAPAEAP